MESRQWEGAYPKATGGWSRSPGFYLSQILYRSYILLTLRPKDLKREAANATCSHTGIALVSVCTSAYSDI